MDKRDITDIQRRAGARIDERSREVHYVLSSKKLGSGSYGSVVRAKQIRGSKEKSVAVKCCEYDREGIPSLIEPVIMTSIVHTNVARAIDVLADRRRLFIVQELAESNLSSWVRGRPSRNMKEAKEIAYGICRGLAHMHSLGIVHADIKPDNILMKSGVPKITDFSLAELCTEGQHFSHMACTAQYRPIECIFKRRWDRSLDVWSLGCTLYYLFYGRPLFPSQSFGMPPGTRDREQKNLIHKRCHSAIVWWAENNPGGRQHLPYFLEHVEPVKFASVELLPSWRDEKFAQVNKLLLAMLHVDYTKRPSMARVLRDPLFRNVSLPDEDFGFVSLKGMRHTTSIHDTSKAIQNEASKIFGERFPDDLLAETATYMAAKIHGTKPSLEDSRHAEVVKEMECDIALALHFHLYTFAKHK